jgi:hypothetical protein
MPFKKQGRQKKNIPRQVQNNRAAVVLRNRSIIGGNMTGSTYYLQFNIAVQLSGATPDIL